MMRRIFLTTKSMTYAQQMKKALQKNGVLAQIVRPDIELTKKSCAFAVDISEKSLPEALDALRVNKLFPTRVLLTENGKSFRELNV